MRWILVVFNETVLLEVIKSRRFRKVMDSAIVTIWRYSEAALTGASVAAATDWTSPWSAAGSGDLLPVVTTVDSVSLSPAAGTGRMFDDSATTFGVVGRDGTGDGSGDAGTTATSDVGSAITVTSAGLVITTVG